MVFLLRALLVALAIAGMACASATPMNFGDGYRRYLISCRDGGACVRKANDLCENGWRMEGYAQDRGPTVGSVNPMTGLIWMNQTRQQSMVARCER